MKLEIIATRDIVANVYSVPMFVPHLGIAIRSFGDECRGKGQAKDLAAHPEDYELWHIGSYEDTNGTATMFDHNERKQIAVGANYRE